jgi:hypothetical protein
MPATRLRDVAASVTWFLGMGARVWNSYAESLRCSVSEYSITTKILHEDNVTAPLNTPELHCRAMNKTSSTHVVHPCQ